MHGLDAAPFHSNSIKLVTPVLMHGLDAAPFHSNSIKLVTQVWNWAFRWLYGVGKFTSTTGIYLIVMIQNL